MRNIEQLQTSKMLWPSKFIDYLHDSKENVVLKDVFNGLLTKHQSNPGHYTDHQVNGTQVNDYHSSIAKDPCSDVGFESPGHQRCHHQEHEVFHHPDPQHLLVDSVQQSLGPRRLLFDVLDDTEHQV